METVPKSPITISETAAAAAASLQTNELPTMHVEVGCTSKGAQGASGEQKIASQEVPQPVAKRGRGRPKGTGKLQTLASFGGLFKGIAGAKFTPHIMIVHEGDDVTKKVFEFNEECSMSTCILSAIGSVRKVDLCIPCATNNLTYEGEFDIVYLSGSLTLGCNGEIITALSITLVDPHGKIFGGKVTGPMIAAEPVQIIMGAFMQETKKKKRVGGGCSSLEPIQENDTENGEAKEAEIENQVPKEKDIRPDNEENLEMPKSSSLTDEIRVPSSNGDGDCNVNAVQNGNDQDIAN